MQIFQDRYDALFQTIEDHLNWFSSLPQTPRLKLLYCLLQRLQAFSKDHFGHFYGQFTAPDFTENTNYPSKHVLSSILFQVASDLDVIRRATADELVANNIPQIKSALQMADDLVKEAMTPALDADWVQCSTIVTYFQKSADIRVVPYDGDTMALLGIPHTCSQVKWDFLAIPHEVGHYVHWNGRLEQMPFWLELCKTLKRSAIPQWIKPWAEEIFADVYGCLVAGPLVALSFQDLQMQESNWNFIHDDGEHPAPVIRPYLYSYILRQMGEESWAKQLDDHWQKHLDERGNPSRIFLQQPNLSGFGSGIMNWIINIFGYREVSVADARSALQQVADIVFQMLNTANVKFSANWWGQFPYGEYRSQNLDALYSAFADYLAYRGKKSEPIYRWDECENTKGLWDNWRRRLEQNIALMARTEINCGCDGRNDPSWCNLWRADGWATKGPQATWG